MQQTKKNVRFHDGKTGAALAIRVIPGAPKTQIASIMEDGTIKIKVAAPPVEGKANIALTRFLADILSVSESKIEIISGARGHNKLVSIIDISPSEAEKRILAAMQAGKS
ncbi:MAG: DUF167 domain-containing protein [Anaerolineaceae bacterium]|jgi:hypothetical protein